MPDENFVFLFVLFHACSHVVQRMQESKAYQAQTERLLKDVRRPFSFGFGLTLSIICAASKSRTIIERSLSRWPCSLRYFCSIVWFMVRHCQFSNGCSSNRSGCKNCFSQQWKTKAWMLEALRLFWALWFLQAH